MDNTNFDNFDDGLLDKLMAAMDNDNPYSYDDLAKDLNKDAILPNINSNDIGHIDSFSIKLNFVNKSQNEDPAYATSGSAGFDLRSNIKTTIQPGDFEKVPTGLFFELPPNFEMQVRPRSGLAAKHGVTVLNSPGTIDSDYRGEIIVILINHGKEPFVIEVGDRIAQGVIATTCTSYMVLNKVNEISDNTERSSGGFGSTGIK